MRSKCVNSPVVIKSCKELMGEGFRERKGMFRMNQVQHLELIKQKGCYLFKLEHINHHTTLLLIEASEIVYQNNITWSSIIRE